MVKTKGGRDMNPADAHRKEQRRKEVSRNKTERKFMREAASKRSKPDEIKEQLQILLDMEEDGPLPKNLQLKKKALQEALQASVRKGKEDETQQKQLEAGLAPKQ
ncbi:MAG: hypothetical protein WDW38_005710 [Sanguina aurantia]